MADAPRAPARPRLVVRDARGEAGATFYEWREESRRRVYTEREHFDRVRFARRVLDALRPPALTVLIRAGFREIHVERGEDWARPGCDWACVAVPGNATREEIVFALLELVGAKNDPYWSDVLLRLPQED
jgi:hypothetical protein